MNKHSLINNSIISRSWIFFVTSLVIFISLYFFSIFKLHSEQEICVCTFADLLNKEIVSEFEKETGIKVLLKYCEFDSEFLSQMSSFSGKNIDLVTPTNFIAKKLLKKALIDDFIDTSSIKNLKSVHPKFKNGYASLEKSSIPFAWTYYIMAYNPAFFENETPKKLAAIFDAAQEFKSDSLLKKYKFSIFEDNPLEIISLLSLFAFGKTGELTSQEKLTQALKKLGNYKKHLNSYISSNLDYHLKFTSPLILTHASLFKKTENKSLTFCVPEEGTLIVPQFFCISKNSSKKELAIKFINFILQEKIMTQIFQKSGYLPCNENLLKCLEEDPLVPTRLDLDKKFFIIEDSVDSSFVESCWFYIKNKN